MRRILWALLLVPVVSACTWVKMAPGGSAVRVAAAGPAPVACEKRGVVSVSVKDRLGPYERNALKVRDELETLARNEAPGLGADTIQPLAEPVDGEQRFTAFRCRGAAPAATAAPAERAQPLPEGEAQTYPVDG